MNGGTNLSSEIMKAFFKTRGVSKRLLSDHFSQSTDRAEASVKSEKWVLRGNTGVEGNLEDD